jgi:hypothetical protein
MCPTSLIPPSTAYKLAEGIVKRAQSRLREPIRVSVSYTVTNQNSVHEEIKTRLKSRNACFHSVQNLLSSSLLSKNVKIKIYRTIILPVRFPMQSFEFFSDLILQVAIWPWGRLSL